MARGKVIGGGGMYFTRDEWLEMAEKQSLVMFRKHRKLPDKEFENQKNGPTACVLVDIAVITGPFAGRTLMGVEQIGNGLTNELIRQADGNDLPAKIVHRKRGATDYAAITMPSDTEVAKIDETFPPGKEDDVWRELAAKAEAERENEDGGGTPAAATAGASAGGGDDSPPW